MRGLLLLSCVWLVAACKQPVTTCQRVQKLYEIAHNPGPFPIADCEADIRDLSWSDALCVQGCAREATYDKFAACRPQCFVSWGQPTP
jgi:hypothetical protein